LSENKMTEVPVERISYLLGSVQRSLFPHLREEVGELTEKERRFVLVLEVVEVEKHVGRVHWLGRKPKDRKALARSFVAKAFYNTPTTGALRERLKRDKTFRRLCGWECKYQVPSESTFSRAFEEFANSELADRVHEALVKDYVGDDAVWHVSRDSTAIEAREKPAKKIKAVASKEKCKRGRPKKGEARPVPEKKRLEKQREWSLEECLRDLPRACDVGTKKDSKGYKTSWIGYKFNADVADGGIPLSGITTSASMHDSQAAIPLARMTAQRVESFYDLMDAAYDAEPIRQTSLEMGHVPIIDRNARGGKIIPMEPDRARRYNNRTTAERFNSDLKDNHGGSMVRVRGNKKVHAHLMFGVLVIFAKSVIGLVT
jgi:hypothetical protein